MDHPTHGAEAFLSGLLLESFKRRGRQLDEPYSESLQGALLFGDLSGFTALAERLASDRRRGAEETQRILNQHFGHVLEVIHHWGGTVLKLAGDASIAVWLAGDEGLSVATARATRCALDIQARLRMFARTSTENAMQHRVVVGAGALWLAHVGGLDDKWEFIVAGQTWHQIRLADARARPGDVVLSSEAWTRVIERAEGRKVGAGCVLVSRCDAPPLRAATMAAHVDADQVHAAAQHYSSRALQAHLLAGQRDWVAEYRWVTVLFLTIDGIEPEDAGALRLLHAAARSVQQHLAQCGGHIVQFMMDDKGLVALAAWGLPLNAFEDGAERALRAARLLQNTLQAQRLSPRVGIHAGRVFAGLLGSNRHLEYAIIGDPVNTASRIMTLATSEPLCDRATRDAAQRRFELQRVGAVQVKGKREPLEVYRVVVERARRESFRPRSDGVELRPLVDRRVEIALVAPMLEALKVGGTGLTHIVGEPGVGKSSLLEHIRSQALRHDVRCALGAGDSLHRTEAYFAIAQLLPAVLEQDDLSKQENVLQALALLGARQELAPLLNPLLPTPLAENAYTRRLDTSGRADLTRELLVSLITAARQRAPLLLILDDAHWFDSATWSLIWQLQRQAQPVAMIVASRPLQRALLPMDARRMLEHEQLQTISLDPLSYEDSRTLIASRLDVKLVSDDLAHSIYERAEGNPLFTEELLLSLEQQTAIRRIEQRAALSSEAARRAHVVFPDSVDGVVTSRITGLSADEQLTIKVASVLGRNFHLRALSAVHPVAWPPEQLAAQLEVMCGYQLLEHSGETDAYRFHHSVIQNVVHDLLVTEQQRQLHAAAASWLEHDAQNDRAHALAILAHHWGMAKNDRKAIDYLELAAQQARRDHAMPEVIFFLQEAFARAERCADAVPAQRRARWQKLLGEAEVELGQLSSAEKNLGEAVSYLDQRYPRSHARLTIGLGRACLSHLVLRLNNGVSMARRRPRDSDRALAAAHCYEELAAIHYNNHDLGHMLYATLAGANLAWRVGKDSATLARMLADLSIVATVVPGIQPDYYATQALRMAERLNEAGALQEVLMVVANYEMGAGRFRDALFHCERAVKLSHATGEARNWEICAGTLANVYRLRGEFAQADELDRAVLQSGLDRSVAQTQVWGYFGRACSLTYLNHIEELREVLTTFGALLADAEIAAQVSASNVVAYWLTTSLLALHDGNAHRAVDALERAVQLVSSLDHLQAYMTCTLCHLHAALMGCYRRGVQSRRLARLARQADRFVERCARMFPSAVPRAHLGRGHRALRRGDMKKARQAYARALLCARAIANPFDEASALFHLSTCQSLGRVERESYHRSCERLLERLHLRLPFAWTV